VHRFYFCYGMLNEIDGIRLDVLRALVGHIPPHPLWAELLWQRQEELTKRAQAASGSSRPGPPSQNTTTKNHPR